MKWMLSFIALSGLLCASAAHASEPGGFEAQLSLGYGVPFGHAQQTVWAAGSDPAGDLVLPTQLNGWFSSAVPLRLALGWRSPYVFVGMAGQYAWTVPATGPGAACSPCRGVGSDVVVGPAVDVHVLPGGTIDPWLGWDIGIESAQFDGYFPNEGGIPPYEATVNALAWLATWRAGVNLKLANQLRGGPFVSVSYGDLGGPQDGSHGWVLGGLRLVFDSSER